MFNRFASWLHDLQAINLTYRPNPSARGELRNDSMVIFDDKWNIDLSNLKDNSGWTLTEAAFSRREKYDSSCQLIHHNILIYKKDNPSRHLSRDNLLPSTQTALHVLFVQRDSAVCHALVSHMYH